MEEKISVTEAEQNIMDSVDVKPFLICWPDLKEAEVEDDGEKKLIIHAGCSPPTTNTVPLQCNVVWWVWDNNLEILYLRYEGLQKC